MDRQQFLQLVNESLSQAAAVGREPTSSAVSMRQLELQLEPFRQHITPPTLPLPSAECVAAFIDGDISPSEEQHVLSACVHDVGILLQVVSTAEATRDLSSSAVDTELMDRLLALGPAASTLAKPIHPSGSQHSAVNATAVNAMAVNATADVEPQRSAISSPFVLSAAAAIAACLFLAVGWGVVRFAFSPQAAQDNQASAPKEMMPRNDALAGSSPKDDPPGRNVTGRDVTGDDVTGGDGPNILAHDDRMQKSALAGNQPTQDVPQAVDPDSLPTPGLEKESPETDSPTAAVPNLAAQSPQDLPEQNSSVRDRPGTEGRPDPVSARPPVYVSRQPAVAWTEVTGILAQQTESGYDSWVAAKVTPTPEEEDAVDGTWLTPPTCFALGQLGGGGQLVMNEQTNLEARAIEDATAINLRFGAIAFRDLPRDSNIELIDERAAKHRIQVRELAGFELRRVMRGLEFTIEKGDVQLAGVRLEPKRTYLLRGGQVEIIETRRDLPKWSQRLPRSSELSNEILTKLIRSKSLIQGLDEQLVQFSTNIRNATPQARIRFLGLCRWRASMGVEEPRNVLLHPLWPVRMAAFDMLVSTDPRMPFLAARRNLLGKLPQQHRNSVRGWFEVANGRKQATRQELAAWLSLLSHDDAELAALGDYLLRKKIASGPDFLPTAPIRVRDNARKAWTKVITDAANR